MQDMLAFLVRHGYLVVFLWVLIDQIGVPIPGIPMLIAAGALAGAGRLSLLLVLACAMAAALLSDALWFQLGRSKGTRVLGFLCRISLEPESCVRKTTDSFARRGGLTLFLSKFIPGLATAAPPLAGIIGMSWRRFLWLDAAGSLSWILAFVLPGWFCSEHLEDVAEGAALTGAWLLGAFVAVVVLYVLAKFVRRQLFLHRLRVARIAPEELLDLMHGSAPPFIVDLRHGLDFDSDPRTVPGALHFTVDEIERHHELIPRDRDVVLYCT